MAGKNKYILLEQLKKLALSEKSDYVARIQELATLVSEAIESELIPGITVTLPATNWNGNSQTVNNDQFLADGNYWYIVCGDADCWLAYGEAGIYAKNITVSGELQFSCTTAPKEDLTVNIIRMEVITSDE